MVEIIIGGSICGSDAPVASGVSIGYFNTFAELRAQTTIFTVPVTVFVAGDQAANDGFGGLFTWDPSNETLDNGYSIINQTTNAGAGRWVINPEAVAPVAGVVPRNLRDVQGDSYNVFNWGAIADGLTHVLSTVTKFGGQNSTGWTLAQWQVFLPAALALTDEIDWCAWQTALNAALISGPDASVANGGVPVIAPHGIFVINRPLFRPSNVSVKMGPATIIKASTTMVQMMTSDNTRLETGATIEGGTLNCGFSADVGIEINCAQSLTVRDVTVQNSLTSAFKLGDAAAPALSLECNFSGLKSGWTSFPADPRVSSSGLLLIGAGNNYFSECVFRDHDIGVSLNNSSGANRFNGVRVYSSAQINEMNFGFQINPSCAGNLFVNSTAEDCKGAGWDIGETNQVLTGCTVIKAFGTPNVLIGILDNIGSNIINGFVCTGTPAVPIATDIAFVSPTVKASDKIFGVLDTNVTNTYSP